MSGSGRLACSALVAGLLAGCGGDGGSSRAGSRDDTGEAAAGGSAAGGATGTATSGTAAGDSWAPTGEATVTGITADPSRHDGRRVTLRTNVAALVGRHGFTVVDTPRPDAPGAAVAGPGEGPLTSPADAPHSPASEGLLVLTPEQPVERRDLLVSGAVRVFSSAAELRRAAAWLQTASGPELAQYQGRPVILVDSMRTADGRELLSPGRELPASPGEPGGSDQ